MSFNYNPLNHIEIVQDDSFDPKYHKPEDERKPLVLYCHGCGSSQIKINYDTPLAKAFLLMKKHIKDSHDRTAEDFEGWSSY